MELAHVLDARGLEVGHAADDGVLVGMGRERVVVDDLGEAAVRLVLHPLPAFLLDHLTLGLERRVLDTERRHPVRLEPQRERQVLLRHGLPEDRRVLGGVGVALPTDRRDVRGVCLGLHVLAALEHHVFEEVRKAGPPGLLVLRSDVVPERHMDDRGRVILEQDDTQPVGQRVVIELERRRPDGRGRARCLEGSRHDPDGQHGGRNRPGEHTCHCDDYGRPCACLQRNGTSGG